MIKLADVLKEIDQSITPDGKHNHFSIRFVKFNKSDKSQNGKIVQMDRAIKTGLPGNVKASGRIGLIDPYTNERKSCHKHLITHFNNKVVVW